MQVTSPADPGADASCFCAGPHVHALIGERCPQLFAALPAYQAAVLADADPIARHDPGARGVFFGYDFHLGDDALGLLDINTNAGGAMLNAALAGNGNGDGSARAEALEQAIVAMFRNEWRLGGRATPLRTVVIVDHEPETQYFYPEFLLFQALFARHDIEALIVDPSLLRWEAGSLWRGDLIVDLVYNRLSDFMLAAPEHAALRAAYLANAVVLTPHPRAHALYAGKRNLALLSDESRLAALGVPAPTRAILVDGIPQTQLMRPGQAGRLWRTRRAWQELQGGHDVAQAIMAPPARTGGSAQAPAALKFDIRSDAYGGAVQWTAARVYQGQSSNFRTPGGGLAMAYTAEA
jgi:hypothetical protein